MSKFLFMNLTVSAGFPMESPRLLSRSYRAGGIDFPCLHCTYLTFHDGNAKSTFIISHHAYVAPLYEASDNGHMTRNNALESIHRLFHWAVTEIWLRLWLRRFAVSSQGILFLLDFPPCPSIVAPAPFPAKEVSKFSCLEAVLLDKDR